MGPQAVDVVFSEFGMTRALQATDALDAYLPSGIM